MKEMKMREKNLFEKLRSYVHLTDIQDGLTNIGELRRLFSQIKDEEGQEN